MKESESPQLDSLVSAKNEAIDRVIRLVALIGSFTWLASMAASLSSGLLPITILGTFVYGAFIVLAITKAGSFRTKLGAIILASLSIGGAILFLTGLDGVGFLWLLFGLIIVALFGEARERREATIVVASILAAYAVCNLLGWVAREVSFIWLIAVLLNEAIIALLLSTAIRDLLRGYRRTLGQKEYIASLLGAELEATKRAEEELREAARSREELLHELQHRVRNNMQVVLSLVDMARAQGMEIKKLESRIRALSAVNDLYLLDPEAEFLEARDVLRSVSAVCQNLSDPNQLRIGIFSAALLQADAFRFAFEACGLFETLRDDDIPIAVGFGAGRSGDHIEIRTRDGQPGDGRILVLDLPRP